MSADDLYTPLNEAVAEMKAHGSTHPELRGEELLSLCKGNSTKSLTLDSEGSNRLGMKQDSDSTTTAVRPGHLSPSRKPSLFAALLQVGTGWLTVSVLYNMWDFVLFPTAIWKFGPLWGGLLMGILDLIVCLALIRIYVGQSRDWLGFELAKQWIASLNPKHWSARFLKYSLGNPLLAFIVLSWRYDPFVTTAFFRGPGSGTLTRKGWMIFTGSLLFGTIAWTGVCYAGVEMAEALWTFLWGSLI